MKLAVLALRDQEPPVTFGPLERLFHPAPTWTDAEAEATLHSGDQGRELVIRGLSLSIYTNDARELEPRRLSSRERPALST